MLVHYTAHTYRYLRVLDTQYLLSSRLHLTFQYAYSDTTTTHHNTLSTMYLYQVLVGIAATILAVHTYEGYQFVAENYFRLKLTENSGAKVLVYFFYKGEKDKTILDELINDDYFGDSLGVFEFDVSRLTSPIDFLTNLGIQNPERSAIRLGQEVGEDKVNWEWEEYIGTMTKEDLLNWVKQKIQPDSDGTPPDSGIGPPSRAKNKKPGRKNGGRIRG